MAKSIQSNDLNNKIQTWRLLDTPPMTAAENMAFDESLLVDFDVDTMLRALKIPVGKLKAKEIDSVKERVTCLKWIQCIRLTPKHASTRWRHEA